MCGMSCDSSYECVLRLGIDAHIYINSFSFSSYHAYVLKRLPLFLLLLQAMNTDDWLLYVHLCVLLFRGNLVSC